MGEEHLTGGNYWWFLPNFVMLMKKRLPVLLLLAAVASPSFAYTDHRGHNLDSLEREVAKWTPDAIDKASEQELLDLNMAYRGLMLGYSSVNSQKCEFYARKALSVSESRGWPYATFDACRHIGQGFWVKEEFDSARFYYNKAVEAIERMEAGDSSPSSPNGYDEKAIDDAKSSLYGTMGNLYSMQDSIPQAMEWYEKAGELFKKHGWNVSNAVLNYNIGETWLGTGNLKKAEKAYLKALYYAREADDSLWIACSKQGLGHLYLERRHTGKALRLLNEADEYFSRHDHEELIARKDNFQYTSMALEQQKKQLAILLGLSVVVALLLLLMWRLRVSRKKHAETGLSQKETISDQQSLTQREKEILDLLSKGYTSPQIAECLNLSPETVKWYRKKLLVKFDVANVAELIAKVVTGNR